MIVPRLQPKYFRDVAPAQRYARFSARRQVFERSYATKAAKRCRTDSFGLELSQPISCSEVVLIFRHNGSNKVSILAEENRNIKVLLVLLVLLQNTGCNTNSNKTLFQLFTLKNWNRLLLLLKSVYIVEM